MNQKIQFSEESEKIAQESPMKNKVIEEFERIELEEEV